MPWDGDYHININMQMMYWGALATNLEETVEPLDSWLRALAQSGHAAARCMYGVPKVGFCPELDPLDRCWVRTQPAMGRFLAKIRARGSACIDACMHASIYG